MSNVESDDSDCELTATERKIIRERLDHYEKNPNDVVDLKDAVRELIGEAATRRLFRARLKG